MYIGCLSGEEPLGDVEGIGEAAVGCGLGSPVGRPPVTLAVLLLLHLVALLGSPGAAPSGPVHSAPAPLAPAPVSLPCQGLRWMRLQQQWL